MRYLFFLIALFPLVGIGQNDNFVGTWISDDTTAELIITKDGDELQFANYDPSNQDYFEEITLRQLPNEINTTLYRPENEWSLDVTYHLFDKNTLVADCFGSYYGRIFYNRLDK